MNTTPGHGTWRVERVGVAGRTGVFDLTVEDGVIRAVDAVAGEPTGGTVLPGLVDLHTHLREPGGEEAETLASGAAAAAAGGFTDVFAMANTSPVTDTVARVREVRRRARGLGVRVHPVAAATAGLAGEAIVDVAALAAAGVTVFSDDGKCVNDDNLVLELLTAMARYGTAFAQHAQSAAIVRDGVVNAPVAAGLGVPGWPGAGEEAVIGRDLALAAATGGRLHICHVSTAGSVALVRAAKREGLSVTAEVTPHHLMLTDTQAAERGPALKVNPPLRSATDVAAVRAALRDGTIDVVATDHAPHPARTKTCSWLSAAFGLTSLETALPVVAEVFADPATGAVDWTAVARVMSTAPAAIGRIAHLAGRPVAVGEPATFCVVRPQAWRAEPATWLSRSANSPFHGRDFAHRVTLTVLEGRPTHGRLTPDPPTPMSPPRRSSPLAEPPSSPR
ncbi:dihydroorotase [Streptomyces sp. NPDC087422]|uniref:dihydroorotase n=1 Tax=Streptomyces sp. NPDC087422 TaxID=3365786 RepID=UPI0038080088